ncbi:hypothetical protein B0H13DRAFT_2263328, partial [Mycena leptocephala]
MPLLLPSNVLVCLRSTSNRCSWLSGVSRPLQDLDLVWLTLFGALNLMTPLPYFPHPSALLRTEPHVALSILRILRHRSVTASGLSIAIGRGVMVITGEEERQSSRGCAGTTTIKFGVCSRTIQWIGADVDHGSCLEMYSSSVANICFYFFFMRMCAIVGSIQSSRAPVKYAARKTFWRQNRIWRRLSFYVARSHSGVLA